MSIINFAASNPGLDPASLGPAVGCHGVWVTVSCGHSVQQGEGVGASGCSDIELEKVRAVGPWTLPKASLVGGRPFASRTRNGEGATYLPYHITMPSSPSGCAQRYLWFRRGISEAYNKQQSGDDGDRGSRRNFADIRKPRVCPKIWLDWRSRIDSLKKFQESIHS